MKHFLMLSMLLSMAIICSCQKQDSTAEQELAKRKADLDAAEKALNERMDALDERVNVIDGRVNLLIERDQTAANTRTIPTQAQSQVPNPTPVQTEGENTLQQVPADLQSFMADDQRMKAEKEKAHLAQTHRGLDRAESRRRKLEMSRAGASHPAEAGSPTSSPTP